MRSGLLRETPGSQVVIWSSASRAAPRATRGPARRARRRLRADGLAAARVHRADGRGRVDHASVAATISPPLLTSATMRSAAWVRYAAMARRAHPVGA